MLPPPDDPKPGWDSWKEKYRANKAGRLQDRQNTPPPVWRAIEDRFKCPPEELVPIVEGSLESLKRRIEQEIQEGKIIVAAHSEDPQVRSMQDPINEMAAASGEIKTPPQLLRHTAVSETPLLSREIQAAAMFSEYIHASSAMIQHGMKHPDKFKVIMAHELGHIANGDPDPLRKATRLTRQPNEEWEVLADRKAAIIYGNAKKYARDILEAFEDFPAIDPGARSQDIRGLYLPDDTKARMLHKWAEVLEQYRWTEEGHPWNDGRGATDKHGNMILDRDESDGVLKPLRALDVFAKSREFTQGLLAMDLAIRQAQHGERKL